MKPYQAQTFYELLEISVSAGSGEVAQAYERLTRLYADDQVALYGLIDPERAQGLRNRLREAFEVLSDDSRRDEYDRRIGLPPRDGPVLPVKLPQAVQAPAPSAPSVPASEPAAGPVVTNAWGSAVTFVSPQPVAATPAEPTSWVVKVEAPAPKSEAGEGTDAAKAEAEKAEAAKLEAEKVEAVKLEAAKAEAEKAEAAKLEAEKMEAAKLEAEKAEAAKLEAAKAEAEKAEAAKLEAEKAEKAEAAKREAEQARAATVEAEKAEAAKLEAEKADEAKAPEPPTQEPADANEKARAAPERADTDAADVPRLSDDVEVSIVRARATPGRPADRPKPFQLPAGAEVNGELIKQVRMARGVSLQQLSERTRISTRHLESVEGDRYDMLPAAVYLRGILMSISRELGLDGVRVSQSYLQFVEAHRSKG